MELCEIRGRWMFLLFNFLSQRAVNERHVCTLNNHGKIHEDETENAAGKLSQDNFVPPAEYTFKFWNTRKVISSFRVLPRFWTVAGEGWPQQAELPAG